MESLSLCLPLKPNTQKHFPLVHKDATSSLCRSLRVHRTEWGSSRKVLFWLSALTQRTKQRPHLCVLCGYPSSTWHLTSDTSGVKTLIPQQGINLARRIEISWEQAPSCPARCVSQAASSSHPPLHLQILYWRHLPGKLCKTKKAIPTAPAVYLLAAMAPGAPKSWSPLCRGSWVHHPALYIYFTS